MAFKTVDAYNEDKYKGKFRLPEDGNQADVIFLYRGLQDELQCDAHYIQSTTYSGYVHCNGAGCPLCSKKKKDGTPRYNKAAKLFIPLYNIATDKVEFWDRNMTFEPQLRRDVFTSYPNPSELVFKITRHGESNSRETNYEIRAISKNTYKPYDTILSEKGIKMPDYFDTIIKEFSNFELDEMLSSPSTDGDVSQDYVPVPRGFTSSMPTTYVDMSSVVSNVASAPTDVDIPTPEVPFDIDDGDLADPMF